MRHGEGERPRFALALAATPGMGECAAAGFELGLSCRKRPGSGPGDTCNLPREERGEAESCRVMATGDAITTAPGAGDRRGRPVCATAGDAGGRATAAGDMDGEGERGAWPGACVEGWPATAGGANWADATGPVENLQGVMTGDCVCGGSCHLHRSAERSSRGGVRLNTRGGDPDLSCAALEELGTNEFLVNSHGIVACGGTSPNGATSPVSFAGAPVAGVIEGSGAGGVPRRALTYDAEAPNGIAFFPQASSDASSARKVPFSSL